MFVLREVHKRFGGQIVLDGANWQPPHRGVVGLVGPNGAGKTTLLRIIADVEELDAGRIDLAGGRTIGYLPQELAESDAAGSALDTILAGQPRLLQLEADIERLEGAMREKQPGAVEEHATAMEEYEMKGGWTFRARARQIASGLGFLDETLNRPITTFSGGWRMRALLGRLLLRQPDVLLLDEPTNHLDTETLEWLEEFLKRYEGLVVVVSHDRWFLNDVAARIAELQAGRITEYVGNWDVYREKKAERMEQLQAAADRQEREVARVREFIEKFRYKATKAKQVQSRVKQLEKMDEIEVPTEETRNIEFRFPQPPRTPKVVAEAKDVTKRYGNVTVWDDLNFTVRRGDKIALMGPNGAGKTTLLKIFADALEFDAGEVRIGPGVDVAYFAQHAVEQLNPDNTVLREITDAADYDMAPQVRTILGTFGFSGPDVDKLIKVLSGGEKNRLALAKMMLNPAGLLLLDEPTNHLDIASRQVLEFALNDYDGAYIIVSHDRYFVNEVAEQVVHLESGNVTTYLGDYEYYKWKRDQQADDDDSSAEPSESDRDVVSKKDMRRAAAELRKQKKAATGELRKEFERLEHQIASLEQSIEEAETQLADPDVYSDEGKAARWTRTYRESGEALEAAMESWMLIGAEIEEIEKALEED